MKTRPHRMLVGMLAAIAAVVVASGVSPSTPASATSSVFAAIDSSCASPASEVPASYGAFVWNTGDSTVELEVTGSGGVNETYLLAADETTFFSYGASEGTTWSLSVSADGVGVASESGTIACSGSNEISVFANIIDSCNDDGTFTVEASITNISNMDLSIDIVMTGEPGLSGTLSADNTQSVIGTFENGRGFYASISVNGNLLTSGFGVGSCGPDAPAPEEGSISGSAGEGSITLTWDPESFFFPKATGCTQYRFTLETSLIVPVERLDLSINASPGGTNVMVFEGSFTPVPQVGSRPIVMELCQPFVLDSSLSGWGPERFPLGELIASIPPNGGAGIEAVGLVSVKPIRDPRGQFSDVPSSRPFAKEIEWLAGSGITQGFSDGTFRPLGTVNRDAMAAFLYRFAGRPAFTAPSVSPFSDISPSTPFYKEITWLASTGITGGFSDGTYRPQGTINRDAMAAFLYRFAGRPSFTPPATSPFSDVTPSTPFYKEITWLAQTGITGGFSDGSFRAVQPVNRDAMAAFLFRFDDKGLFSD